MRIAILIDHLQLAGAIRWAVDLANALVYFGHEVVIGTESGKACDWLPVVPQVYAWDKLPGGSWDAVLMYNYIVGLRKVADRMDARVRVLYIVGMDEWHDDLLLHTQDPATVNFRQAVKSGGYTIAGCARWITDWIKRNLNPGCQLWWPGVNFTLFHPVPGARRPGELKLISSGKYREREGSICVTKAVEIIRKKHPGALFETYYKKGLPQSEMARFYASGTLWLDGQWYGGLCLAPGEAMACGTPIVCTNIGGVKDYAINNVNALFVPVEDPQAMADAAEKLLRDQALYNRFIYEGFRSIREFTWERSVRQIEGIIANVTG